MTKKEVMDKIFKFAFLYGDFRTEEDPEKIEEVYKEFQDLYSELWSDLDKIKI